MLHAIEKNKSKLYERYWGVRDSFVSGNITAEDEITSTIFGPLEFMTPSDVWCIARKMLGDKAAKDVKPVGFELKFWNKLKSEKENDIEPDAELIFDCGGGEFIAILFELKWNALEGKDKEGRLQLDKQWPEFKLHLKEKKNCDCYHLFIAKENAVNAVKGALEKQERVNIWGNKLIR